MRELYNLAIKLYNENRYADAKIIIKYILPQNSINGDIYNTFGMIEQNLNNNDEAKKFFKIANLLDPDNRVFIKNLENIFTNIDGISTDDDKKTVIISGHLPIDNTGYSKQTYYLAKILVENEYNVKIIGWNATNMKGLQFKELNYNQLYNIYNNLINFKNFEENNPEKLDTLKKINYYTALEPNFPSYLQSNEYFDIIIKKVKPEFIIFLQDIYVMKFSRFLCPTISWLPVHSEPLDKFAYASGEKFDSFVALSEFGKKQISEKFKDKLITNIPHIIDDDIFYVKNDKNYVNNLRDKYKIEHDCFVCLIISNNSI